MRIFSPFPKRADESKDGTAPSDDIEALRRQMKEMQEKLDSLTHK
jgi:polyhydroxyalkanoate synthesis regulator protein